MLSSFTTIDPTIFRAYDIRGISHDNLTNETVYLIGQALGSFFQEHGECEIYTARDGRLSGPSLSESLIAGLLSTGCDVVNIDRVPTPLLYFAAKVVGQGCGIMLTGSHNPPAYNGLKMTIKGRAFSEEEIQSLYHRILNQQFTSGTGIERKLSILDAYQSQFLNNLHLAKPLKIVVDAGNGVAGFIAPALYRALGCEVYELHCEIDGSFPNHHPDPSDPHNLCDLITTVREQDADVGLAFDGDGDRLGVVTSKGDVIWPDRLLMLFAKQVLMQQPAATIIYDVKCTHHLATHIEAFGGKPLMWKTGHSFIKLKMQEAEASLAGEMSGHFFFKDRWHGFDDALYAGGRLLEILSNETGSSDAIFKDIPNSINTPELKIPVTESEKFTLMQLLLEQANFLDASISTIDGLRVNFAEGWGLVRPSNTTPYLIMRFEAINQSILENIQSLFRHWILSVKPDLILPF